MIFSELLSDLRGKYSTLSTTQRRVTVLVYTTQIERISQSTTLRLETVMLSRDFVFGLLGGE